jgi:hypothetical protein
MQCVGCGSTSASERTACANRRDFRFCCRSCGKQSNRRNAGLLNVAQYHCDVVALVVFWRLRYRLALSGMMVHALSDSY